MFLNEENSALSLSYELLSPGRCYFILCLTEFVGHKAVPWMSVFLFWPWNSVSSFPFFLPVRLALLMLCIDLKYTVSILTFWKYSVVTSLPKLLFPPFLFWYSNRWTEDVCHLAPGGDIQEGKVKVVKLLWFIFSPLSFKYLFSILFVCKPAHTPFPFLWTCMYLRLIPNFFFEARIFILTVECSWSEKMFMKCSRGLRYCITMK